MMISRRRLAAGLALTPMLRPAMAQVPVLLRFSTAAPPSDFLAKSLDMFKDDVAQANAGVKVETFPASTLFKQGTEVPALQRGTLDMSTMTTFEVADQLPEYDFFNRAYLFRDYDHLRHVFDGPIGRDYRDAVAKGMGLQILATAYLGTRQVNLRKKRGVTSPADLAGVKIRMPAGPQWLLLGRVLGASPAPMGMPEVYLALKTGTIDAQENPLSVFNAAKFYEVTEQIVLTAHMLQPVFFTIAQPAWDKLDPAQKAMVQAAAQKAAKANDDGRLADEKSILDMLKGRGLSIDAPDLAAFRANADKVYAAAPETKRWNTALMQRVIEQS